MNVDEKDKLNKDEFSSAKMGNSSNPAPDEESVVDNNQQLLDKKAETYLRESGNIEDMPDEKDWQEANKTIDKEKEEEA